MNYVLDTNILIHILTGSVIGLKAKQKMQESTSYYIISIVTKAEMLSIAKQNKWGEKKTSILNKLLDEFLIIPIDNDQLIETYAEIDTYSQNKLEGKPLGMSSRNMGKNDLWIAATSHLVNAILLTTDKDFDHLDKVYFDVDNLN
ncbi:MAG: type II toxin-antitoxin system VapC family toxin [Bacteroidales bacterium]|nr:type II toxin-antitoxin system VapC family toxin [Bacteroidales bacterium]